MSASVPCGFSMIWSTCASVPQTMRPQNWHCDLSLAITASRVRRHAAEQYPRSAAFGRDSRGLFAGL